MNTHASFSSESFCRNSDTNTQPTLSPDRLGLLSLPSSHAARGRPTHCGPTQSPTTPAHLGEPAGPAAKGCCAHALSHHPATEYYTSGRGTLFSGFFRNFSKWLWGVSGSIRHVDTGGCGHTKGWLNHCTTRPSPVPDPHRTWVLGGFGLSSSLAQLQGPTPCASYG